MVVLLKDNLSADWAIYPTYGIIDEVRIYDHALSQSEILADMIAPTPPRTIYFAAYRHRYGWSWRIQKEVQEIN
jgi:hypothetical protein